MQIRGFKKLSDIETRNINGGWTCPKTKAAFTTKLKSLSYENQKKYIKFVYENCPVPSN